MKRFMFMILVGIGFGWMTMNFLYSNFGVSNEGVILAAFFFTILFAASGSYFVIKENKNIIGGICFLISFAIALSMRGLL